MTAEKLATWHESDCRVTLNGQWLALRVCHALGQITGRSSALVRRLGRTIKVHIATLTGAIAVEIPEGLGVLLSFLGTELHDARNCLWLLVALPQREARGHGQDSVCGRRRL